MLVILFTVLELGPLKKKIERDFRRCFRHCKGRKSLYGTRVWSEISCLMDQSNRRTDLRVWSQSQSLSGSFQRSTSKNPRIPASISERRHFQPCRPEYDWWNRTISIVWIIFRIWGGHSANSGNWSFRSRQWCVEDGLDLGQSWSSIWGPVSWSSASDTRFPQHSGVGLTPTEMDCVNLFMHQIWFHTFLPLRMMHQQPSESVRMHQQNASTDVFQRSSRWLFSSRWTYCDQWVHQRMAWWAESLLLCVEPHLRFIWTTERTGFFLMCWMSRAGRTIASQKRQWKCGSQIVYLEHRSSSGGKSKRINALTDMCSKVLSIFHNLSLSGSIFTQPISSTFTINIDRVCWPSRGRGKRRAGSFVYSSLWWESLL